MTEPAYTLFDTAVGRCAIAWCGPAIVGVQLPEAREAATRARMLRRFPGAREASPPPAVQRALDAIATLLRGATSDLSAIALDMEGVPSFHRRVYEVARTIAPGATLTYGEIAKRLGEPGSARAVGQALGRNPFAIVVPCHRVVAAGGKVGGFSASGGAKTKLRMLEIERAAFGIPSDHGQLALFDGDGAFGFDPDVAVAHLRTADTALARVIDAAGPFRMEVKKTSSLFGALAEAIVYQQLNGKAAATIYGRVCALGANPHHGPTAEQILRTDDDSLRGAGLSRPKLLALRDLARRTAAGALPTLADVHRMDDEAVVERLTEVRGIGRWTVEMLLMFRLGRPDVLPADDYGVRKGFAVAFRKGKRPPPNPLLGKEGERRDLPTREDVEKRGLRWKPYRTVASWYLWRAAERPKQ